MPKGFYINTINTSYVDNITNDVEDMMEDIQDSFSVTIPTWTISSDGIRFPMMFTKNDDDYELVRSNVLNFVEKKKGLFDSVSATSIIENIEI